MSTLTEKVDVLNQRIKSLEEKEVSRIKANKQRKCKHEELTVKIDSDGYVYSECTCRTCNKVIKRKYENNTVKKAIKKIHRSYVKT